MPPSFLPDTSCMIAAVCSWHEHHESAANEIERRLTRREKMIVAAPALVEPGFRSRKCHGEEFRGKVGGRSTIGVMILSGWVGVWSVTDHSNCAAIGSPCETVRNRRKNSGRS